jgi:hypothetical protein
VYYTGTLIDLTGPSWSWSYGSRIYNYLSNQCLSPLMLWVRILIRARCTTLCDKVCQWLEAGWWFSPVSATNKTDQPRYNRNIVESSVKHQKPTNHTHIPKSSNQSTAFNGNHALTERFSSTRTKLVLKRFKLRTLYTIYKVLRLDNLEYWICNLHAKVW